MVSQLLLLEYYYSLKLFVLLFLWHMLTFLLDGSSFLRFFFHQLVIFFKGSHHWNLSCLVPLFLFSFFPHQLHGFSSSLYITLIIIEIENNLLLKKGVLAISSAISSQISTGSSSPALFYSAILTLIAWFRIF